MQISSSVSFGISERDSKRRSNGTRGKKVYPPTLLHPQLPPHADLTSSACGSGTCSPGITPVVSTVHALQVVADDEIAMEEHDTPLDWVVTPEGAVATHTKYPQPGKLDWTKLRPDQYDSIPFLKTLRKELDN